MTNIKEAIVGTPGTLIESKSQGYDARLIIRGAGLKARYAIREVMVLLNGIPITDPDSLTRLDFVDTHLVERIEVVRGPNSTLWGINSTGGAINVVTRSPFDGQGGGARMDVGSLRRPQRPGGLHGRHRRHDLLQRELQPAPGRPTTGASGTSSTPPSSPCSRRGSSATAGCGRTSSATPTPTSSFRASSSSAAHNGVDQWTPYLETGRRGADRRTVEAQLEKLGDPVLRLEAGQALRQGAVHARRSTSTRGATSIR